MDETMQAYVDAAIAALQEQIDELREKIAATEAASLDNIQNALGLVPQIVVDTIAAQQTLVADEKSIHTDEQQ